MPQLFTELHVQEPPSGKFAPEEVGGKPRVTLESTTDDPALTAAALDKGNGANARTLSPHNQAEVSVDGSTTTAVIEPPDSERNRFEELQRRLEEAENESLRDFQPLTEADSAAKESHLATALAEGYNEQLEKFRESHPDFDQVLADADVEISPAKRRLLMEAGPQALYDIAKSGQAEQFSAMTDAQAEQFLAGNRTAQPESASESGTEETKTDYDRVLALAAEKGTLEGTAETLDRFAHPDTPQMWQAAEVVAAVLKNETSPEEYVPIVHNLLSNPTTAGKLETAESADQIVELVRNAAKWVREMARTKRLTEIKQRYAASKVQNIRQSTLPPPGKPVRGSMKGTVPMDQLPYDEYCKERDRQIKARKR